MRSDEAHGAQARHVEAQTLLPDLCKGGVDGAAATHKANVACCLQAGLAPLAARQQEECHGQGAKHKHEAAVLAQRGHKEGGGEQAPQHHDERLADLEVARVGSGAANSRLDQVLHHKEGHPEGAVREEGRAGKCVALDELCWEVGGAGDGGEWVCGCG